MSSFPCSVNLSSLVATLAAERALFHTQALLWGLTFFPKVNKHLCDLTATFCLDALPGNIPLTYFTSAHFVHYVHLHGQTAELPVQHSMTPLYKIHDSRTNHILSPIACKNNFWKNLSGLSLYLPHLSKLDKIPHR